MSVAARKAVAAPAPHASTAARGSNLEIADAEDALEREADRWADRALMGVLSPPRSLAGADPGARLQRRCACGQVRGEGDCAECQTDRLRRKPSPASAAPRRAPASVDEVLRSPGAPLDRPTRVFFERRFHHDFSRVRIHADTAAAASARAVQAEAYTVGRDIVFGAGRYGMQSEHGRRLLAHELAHTLQQGAAPPLPVLRRASIGWRGAPPGSRNLGESAVGSIRRIAVDGLSQGFQAPGMTPPSGRAIVLIPSSTGTNAFDPTKPVDVLLHFHGWDASYERDSTKQYKDVDVFEIEKQMEAAGNPQLVGLLPQGSAHASFGGASAGNSPPACDAKNHKGFDTDAFIQEIFALITSQNLWSSAASTGAATPTVAGVLLSGHSGAGELINENLLGGTSGSSLPSQLGSLKEVALFDAINGPCEFLMLSDWLARTLTKELGDLKGKSEPEQLKYLKTSVRFRSYFSTQSDPRYRAFNQGPLPDDPNAHRLIAGRKPIKSFLDDWFMTLGATVPATVAAAWRNNYVVVDMGQVAHDLDPINVMTAPSRGAGQPGGATPLTESIKVLPKREGSAAPAHPDAGALIRRALVAPGVSLDAADRAWARRHFGEDLSPVRIHADAYAAASARALHARAFTVGRDIVFGPGQYAPRSPEGRRLLAHELAHVLQQGARAADADQRLDIGPRVDGLEREADERALQPGPVRSAGDAALRVQRAPAEGQLAKQVCEKTQNPGIEQPGECNYARPENCPTYESWLGTFTQLRSFKARAAPVPSGTSGANTFDVLGGETPDPADPKKSIPAAAARFESTPNRTKGAAPDPTAPVPPTALKLGETFIHHPTDAWVKACLPDNLRATAYALPADCADIAIILRHVWLSAHHRTQTLRWGTQSWTIGDAKGGAAAGAALKAITDIGSQSVQSLVAPYSDLEGNQLLSFKALEPLLHAGDILVWEHHENGLDKERTGGHTLTITQVLRNEDGTIQSMSFLQGNEPIFGEAGQADDDKGAIIQAAKLKDTAAVRKQLGSAPGRRIEAVTSQGLGMMPFGDTQRPGARKGAPPRSVWLWGTDTILLAAGPPRAVPRPAAAQPPKGLPAQRRITDWMKSFKAVSGYTDWQAVFESMLLEARAFVEGGIAIFAGEAQQVGEASGQRFWQLAKQSTQTADPRGNEGHYARLQAAKRTVRTIATSRGATNAAASPPGQITQRLGEVMQWIEEAFDLAARGAADITFGADAGNVVKILLTGFDPFEPSGSLAAPSKDAWNSAGAAALALDNQSLSVKSSKGKNGMARVQAIVLPVNFDEFQAGGRGLVEKIVSGKAADLDAAITVSMTPGDRLAPVRLERYVVGTHGSSADSLTPIPAAGGVGAGAAIIASNAPLERIAAATEKPAHGAAAGIPKPIIGETVTLGFSSAAAAQSAAPLLRGVPSGSEVQVANATVMQNILATMIRDPNGVGITFKIGATTLKANVLSGPGGKFLSNEVSYRMLRLLQEKQLAQDPLSFHVHTPSTEGVGDGAAAKAMIDRLIETLRRIIAVTAKEILDRRARSKP